MLRIGLSLVLALALVGHAAAQNPPYQRKGGTSTHRDDMRNPEHGNITGQVSSVRFLGGESKKSGLLDLQTAPGRHFSVSLRDNTDISAAGTKLSGSQAKLLLANGIRITLEWSEDRDPRTGSAAGKWADRITIQTEQIEGIVTALTERGATVSAKPKKAAADMERNEPPPLRVEGRQQPKTPPRKPPPAPVARTVKLVFKPNATVLTFEGKDIKPAELVTAVKGRADIGFEATVISGAGNVVAEFHARSGAEPPGNRGPLKTSKEKDSTKSSSQ